MREFGEACNPAGPHKATHSMVEQYVACLREKGNAAPTINKKLRYLKAAFRQAVKRHYAKVDPTDGWTWEREDQPEPRVVTVEEEAALLEAAERLYGLRWQTFIRLALHTGARRGELLPLTWDRVDIWDKTVRFTHTRGKRDRTVPLNAETTDALSRLQIQTLRAGGPFVGMAGNVNLAWSRIRKAAKVPDVTLHDLRRTATTRLFDAGAAPKTAQGPHEHGNLATTLRHNKANTDKN